VAATRDGTAKTVIISTEQIRKAIEEPVQAIIDAVKVTLDRTRRSCRQTSWSRHRPDGGGALLNGLAARLESETNMPSSWRRIP